MTYNYWDTGTMINQLIKTQKALAFEPNRRKQKKEGRKR